MMSDERNSRALRPSVCYSLLLSSSPTLPYTPPRRSSFVPSLRAAGVAARSERLAIGEPFGRDVREERGTRGGGVRSFLTHPPCGANGMSVG